jgi:hypothetical protein
MVNHIKINEMKNLYELNKDDMLAVSGGESFAYRIGQGLALLWDLTFDGTPGYIDSRRGNLVLTNWFGS